jgi:hypothetical protein
MDFASEFAFDIRLQYEQTFPVPGTSCNVEALGCETLCYRTPDSPASSGNNNQFAHEIVLFDFWVSLAR